MKISLSKKQIIIIAVFTLICLVTGAYICRSVFSSRHYSFDLEALATEGMQISDGALVIDKENDDGSGRFHSTRFSLSKGNYYMSVSYSAGEDYSIYVSLDNNMSTNLFLAASEETASQGFYLEWPTDRAYFNFDMPEGGPLVIRSIDISSDSFIYTDGIFQLLILIVIYAVFLYHAVRFEGYDREKRASLLALLGMAVIVNLPMYLDIGVDGIAMSKIFRPLDAMTRFGIDTRAQLLRLEGVVYGLLDRQYPVIIAPNFLNENGELSFLYPDLFLYPFAAMRLLGSSMLQTFRLMNVAVNIATILSMHYACRQISDKYKLNLIITAFYVFEPHRLRVILAKGAATGMGLPYIFAPLCIAGVWYILHRNKKGILFLALGVTGIIESHVTSTLLLMILLLVVFLTFFRLCLGDGADRMKYIAAAVGAAAVMNLGFMVIFIYYYAVGINASSLLWDAWNEYTLSFPELFTNIESLFYVIGIVAAILILSQIKDRHSTDQRLAIVMIIYVAVFFVLSSKLVPWDFLISHSSLVRTFGNYMQKPHRFYTIMAPALLFAILLLVKDMKDASRSIKAWAAISAIVVLVCAGIKYMDYFNKECLLRDEVIGDMNTRQTYNYLPVGVDKEMDFSGSASLSDESDVESLSYSKRGTHADYTYISHKDGIYAEFPLLLYDGYAADDEGGNEIELMQGEQGRIRAYLNGDGEEHSMHLQFVIKPLFKILYILSFIAGMAMIVFYTVKYRGNGQAGNDK